MTAKSVDSLIRLPDGRMVEAWDVVAAINRGAIPPAVLEIGSVVVSGGTYPAAYLIASVSQNGAKLVNVESGDRRNDLIFAVERRAVDAASVVDCLGGGITAVYSSVRDYIRATPDEAEGEA